MDRHLEDVEEVSLHAEGSLVPLEVRRRCASSSARCHRAEKSSARPRMPVKGSFAARKAVIVLELESGRYAVHGRFEQGARAVSALLEGFSVAVADVFSAAGDRKI